MNWGLLHYKKGRREKLLCIHCDETGVGFQNVPTHQGKGYFVVYEMMLAGVTNIKVNVIVEQLTGVVVWFWP